MNKVIFILLSNCFILCASAQSNISPNVLAAPFQGQHVTAKADNDVEGTPLVFDDWRPGDIVLKSGEKFHLQKINFDGLNGGFIFSKNDTIYDFTDNVHSITIYTENHAEDPTSDMAFMRGLFPGQTGFVQLLVKGKITVVRKFSKKPEGENYSNGIVNNSRKYVLRTEDIAIIDNKIIPIKYSSSSLTELASDKITQVDSYVKSNNLRLKKQNDFLKTINYYNSLNASAN